MNVDLRYPNITGKTETEQLGQVKSYLHQLVEQLNWALNTAENYQSGKPSTAVVFNNSENLTPKEAQATFDSIKALIIKSADIVNAYEETIRNNFEGKYFADSDFGSYLEETSRTIEENSKGVTEAYTRYEAIDSRVEGVEDEIRTTDAYIHRGLLDNGEYGIEIGETSDDGVFSRYARFTSEKLSFHDRNGNEVAYIGAGTADQDDTKCLYVTGKAVFLGEVQLGGYKTDTSDGLAFTWIG